MCTLGTFMEDNGTIFDVVEYLHHLVGDPFIDKGEISCPSELPMDQRIEFEERAAILEYDGGLLREEAEMRALTEIVARMKETGKT